MQFRSNLFAIALAGLGLVASSASAANVHYTLDLSAVSGQFSLLATTSAGDSAGLAVYGIPLSGDVLTMDHLSPVATFASKGAFMGPIGFSNLRSGDIAASTINPTLTGAQDTVSASAPNNLIFNMGETASSFVIEGITPLFGAEQPVWGVPLLIATGTYGGAVNSLGFDLSSVDLIANAFADAGNAAAPSATVTTEVIPFGPGDVFEVDNLTLGGPRVAGALVTAGPLPTNDDDSPDQVAWLLESFIGPGGAVVPPENPASVNATTGVFSWQSMATSPLGSYTATIRGTNNLGMMTPAGTDTGTLTFRLVPEPASVTLLGLAMVGAFGIIRRR